MRVGCCLESLYSQKVAQSTNAYGQAREKAQLLKTNILAHWSQGPGPPKLLCPETTLGGADLVVLVLSWLTTFGRANGECQCVVILTSKAGRCHPVPVGGPVWETANGDVEKRVRESFVFLSLVLLPWLMEDAGGEFREAP